MLFKYVLWNKEGIVKRLCEIMSKENGTKYIRVRSYTKSVNLSLSNVKGKSFVEFERKILGQMWKEQIMSDVSEWGMSNAKDEKPCQIKTLPNENPVKWKTLSNEKRFNVKC